MAKHAACQREPDALAGVDAGERMAHIVKSNVRKPCLGPQPISPDDTAGAPDIVLGSARAAQNDRRRLRFVRLGVALSRKSG